MRKFLAVLGLLALGMSPAFAYDTPQALVDALYAGYLPGGVAVDQVPLRSEALQKFYTKEEERTAAGDGASFDFDPLLSAQDSEITEFAVALTPDSSEYSATADVSFKNFGQPVSLQLLLWNFDGEWKLEDVVSTTPGSEYVLTDLLSPKIVFGDETYGDPRTVVDTLYSPYKVAFDDFEWRRWDETQLYSDGLNALFEADRKEADGEIGRIDFDPFINGQDYDIKGLVVGDATVTGETATVKVAFTNFDNPQDMTIHLVRESNRWKIDDVENANEEYPYRLREILEAPLAY